MRSSLGNDFTDLKINAKHAKKPIKTTLAQSKSSKHDEKLAREKAKHYLRIRPTWTDTSRGSRFLASQLLPTASF